MVQPQNIASPSALSSPVGMLMRPTATIPGVDSINRAVFELRRNGGGVLPVVDEGKLIGVITDQILASALVEGIPWEEASSQIVSRGTTIHPYESGAEALRLLNESGAGALVVIDDAGIVMGLLGATDLFPRRRAMPRPSPVGGMATPFGVYLTSGNLHGGASLFAVMATGALMTILLIVGIVIASPLANFVDRSHAPTFVKAILEGAPPYVFFAILMRLVPLSGVHAAEHMTVHAIERGEELTPEIVARMPRVHPRCGTNLAAGLGLFGLILFTPWYPDEQVRLLPAALVTMFLWRPVGSFAQQYVTTKKPNQAQIRSGIKAGNELIERFATAKSATASIPARFWNSGLPQVFAGSTLTILALKGLMMLFHFQIPGFDDSF